MTILELAENMNYILIHRIGIFHYQEDISIMPNLGSTELIIIFLILLPFALIFAILPVIAFWKICEKAGFSGVLGLLMLVPMANVILPLYVAFAKWPAFEPKRGQEDLID